MTIRRFALEYLVALVFSILGTACIAIIEYLLYSQHSHTTVGVSLLLGLPIGCTLGVLLIDKFVYRMQSIGKMNIAISVVLGIIGPILGIVALDYWEGNMVFFSIPFVTALMSLIGYHRSRLWS